jgi:hypothetical protein
VSNDKVFAAYSLALIAGITALMTALVVSGIGALPSALGFAEHVALALGIRAAYKGVAGWDASDWTFTSGREAVGTGLLAGPGGPAGAEA